MGGGGGGKEQPKITNFGFTHQPQLLEMKLLHEPTDTTSENYLWKGFQFIVISSKKIRKLNSSSLTHSLEWILAGTRVNLGQWPIITSQRSDFSWVMLGHNEKTPPVSVICNAVKAEILFQNSAYNLATLILRYTL